MTILYDGWYPREPKHGRLYLRAWASIEGQYQQCEIIEADAESQSAVIVKRGQAEEITVTFAQIQNVALVYEDGTVLQNFGAPKISREESIFYARGYQDAYSI